MLKAIKIRSCFALTQTTMDLNFALMLCLKATILFRGLEKYKEAAKVFIKGMEVIVQINGIN